MIFYLSASESASSIRARFENISVRKQEEESKAASERAKARQAEEEMIRKRRQEEDEKRMEEEEELRKKYAEEDRKREEMKRESERKREELRRETEKMLAAEQELERFVIFQRFFPNQCSFLLIITHITLHVPSLFVDFARNRQICFVKKLLTRK